LGYSQVYDNEFYLFRINSEDDIQEIAYFFNVHDIENKKEMPVNAEMYHQFYFLENKINFHWEFNKEGKSYQVILDLSQMTDEVIKKKIDQIINNFEEYVKETNFEK